MLAPTCDVIDFLVIDIFGLFKARMAQWRTVKQEVQVAAFLAEKVGKELVRDALGGRHRVAAVNNDPLTPSSEAGDDRRQAIAATNANRAFNGPQALLLERSAFLKARCPGVLLNRRS